MPLAQESGKSILSGQYVEGAGPCSRPGTPRAVVAQQQHGDSGTDLFRLPWPFPEAVETGRGVGASKAS